MRAVHQIKYNKSDRNGTPIKYIVVHDTGNPSRGANATAHYNYFNGGNRNASADFFVDDTQIICVNDYYKYYTWHCGDGHGKYGIANSNSVGVEFCVNVGSDRTETLRRTAQLVHELMSELNIPIERVVRHFDASRKNCPASMSANNWAEWYKFKEMLKGDKQMPKTVYSLDDVHIQVIDTWNFKIETADKPKRNIGTENYANAGYFAVQSGGSTVPVGNLVIDGSIITDAKNQPKWLSSARKAQTTLVVHNDNSAEFVKTDDMMTVPAAKYAVSGIPIIRNGRKVSLDDIKSEGYSGGELYDTWHGFIGIRDNRLVYVAARLDFELMVYLMEVLGIRDAVKLDGGGSFILHNGSFEKLTAENRRINNIISWRG